MSAKTLSRGLLSIIVVLGLVFVAPAATATARVSVIPAGSPDGFVAEVSTSQAGGHPDAVTSFNLAPLLPFDAIMRDGLPLKDVVVDLPPGVLGNPEAVDKCSSAQLRAGIDLPVCPHASQVGTVELRVGVEGSGYVHLYTGPIYVMETAPDKLASLGFNVGTVAAYIDAEVRPGDYGLRLTTRNIAQNPLVPVAGVTVNIWGVPADSSHDVQRCAEISYSTNLCDGLTAVSGKPDNYAPHSSGQQRRPFFSNPTVCDEPKQTVITIAEWRAPGVFDSTSALMPTPTGCEKLHFDPSLTVVPETRRADAPTGLVADLRLPQDGSPDGLATAHMRDVVAKLPQGVSISPAAAHGLGACTDAQLRIGAAGDHACPPDSRIGTATAITPVLADPLRGAVFVASQESQEPESGRMFRIFLVLRGPGGLVIKLRGEVRADPRTGQLEARFENNPQVPVESVVLDLKDGPRAPLATARTCADSQVLARIESWADHVSSSTSSLPVECGADALFAPTLIAGPLDPTAGAFSSLVVRVDRPDQSDFLRDVTVSLPQGFAARLRGVTLCDDSQAAAGACPSASQVGTATVLAGPGREPFSIRGSVYLTSGYRGAPYGLVAVVRAVAGPFDLGVVVVRQALFVDPNDLHVRVISDPVPLIVKGVPARIRTLHIPIDRPKFTTNPTGCGRQAITATLGSEGGRTADRQESVRARECRSLRFSPRVTLGLIGRKERTDGRHPGLVATLKQPNGGAGIQSTRVALPLTLALDPANADALCEYEAGNRADCPRASVIGQAEAASPLLNRPLRGPIYFVKGVRIDRKTGRRIRTLPTLLVTLRGEIDVNLRARSTVDDGRLVTTFASVPDAPVSRFRLRLVGGSRGILVVNGNLCRRRNVAQADFTAHSGVRVGHRVALTTPCQHG